MKPEVIVIGQNPSIILGLVRDLGIYGFDVHVIKTNGRLSYECKSKYVKSVRILFDQDEEVFADFMIRNYSSQDCLNIILPADDKGTLLVDKNVSKLLQYFLFPNIDNEANRITKAMDKWYQKQTANISGFMTARGWLINIKNDEYHIPQEIEYPCFVKPAVYDSSRKKMMFRCQSKEELKNKINEISHKIPLLVEEYVKIDREKAVLGLNTRQGLLISGVIDACEILDGVTNVGIAHFVEPTSNLFVSVKRFLDQIGYYGLFDIDLLESGGKIYFCEMNMRLGNSGVAFLQNIHMAQMLVRSLLGEKIDLTLSKYDSFSFADERVCHAKCINNDLTIMTYYKMVNNVDVRFIKNKGDLYPYLYFLCKQLITYTKIFIKKTCFRKWKSIK